MCTAISFLSKDHYFGRNLDLEYHYAEMITITPRHFPFHFRRKETLNSHYALLGMSYIQKNFPLYYEATNEYGLSMAGLHFPGCTEYKHIDSSKDNIAPFEIIPWILGQCKSIQDAQNLLHNINIWNENFSSELPLTPLHWMLSDRKSSLVIECTPEGLHLWPNPVEILTNAPAFNVHMKHLESFDKRNHSPIPGDWSSESRFLRAVHVKRHAPYLATEQERVSHFLHLLDCVAQPKGCNTGDSQRYKYTIYSSCCNTDKGIYYYKTYDNSQITVVDMFRENLDSHHLISYPLIRDAHFRLQNY